MTLPAGWPSEVRDHRASRTLELVWDDGRASRITHLSLRQGCRCAECE
ncbi:MAG: gamma-butyrobetaine hydroxylase-like domain-containing protein, partial [Verrucomicrobiota bacterium]